MTDSSLLVRLDSGNDAKETLETLRKNKADFIIKRNLRQESKEERLLDAQAFGEWHEPREGKAVYVGDVHRLCGERLWRVVFEVTERTCDRDGQQFLFPQVEIATYWTSLRPKEVTPDEVIALYKAHGTSEQFHSELKTDLDLERLPSGHFDVNALVVTCGMVAYNVLRLIGQISLEENKKFPREKKMPLVKEVKRRWLRSIIQDLMYMASRLIRHARQWCLGIAERNPWYDSWKETYCHIRGAPPIPT